MTVTMKNEIGNPKDNSQLKIHTHIVANRSISR